MRRLTEAEGAALAAQLNEAPGVLSLLWNAVMEIDRNAPEFPMLRTTIADVLQSTARADEILAPTH